MIALVVRTSKTEEVTNNVLTKITDKDLITGRIMIDNPMMDNLMMDNHITGNRTMDNPTAGTPIMDNPTMGNRITNSLPMVIHASEEINIR